MNKGPQGDKDGNPSPPEMVLVDLDSDPDIADPYSVKRTTVYVPQSEAKKLTEKSPLLRKSQSRNDDDEKSYRCRCWPW